MSRGDEPRAPLEPGALFAGRYQVEGALGRGGMGTVYRAQDLSLGEAIALKVLSTTTEAPALDVMRFRQEVRLARRVTHANVARVFDIGEHEGLVYLTMELVDGETLRQLLKREGTVPAGRAIEIGLGLCAGLGAAHAAGVIHRDLKPGNVMLARDGRVVITDFGIAWSLHDAMDLTSGAIGSPSYMAPEQLLHAAIDERTDVYAIGLVLHEMLTGERLSGLPKAGLAPALADLVRRCTAPVPDARPASAEEVARALVAAGSAGEARAPCEDRSQVATGISGAAAVSPAAAAHAAWDAGTRPLGRAPPALSTATSAGPALAVLPFRYRGPKEQEYFGDAITDELVDALARTRGLRVLGSGATARFREVRDPRAIGLDLGVSAVIDGTAQLAGAQVRITVRLVEAATGVQIWTERYDSGLGDLLALQESIAQRVAEELRVELTTLSHRGAAPAAAIELYLAGRHRLRAFDHEGATAAAASLTQCLALAPDFAPAYAAHAIACLRSWFFDIEGGAIDWEAAARASVARALDRAAELAETHLAAGILATHAGDYRAAARAIDRALSIAPTYADAHEYLGMLQCEAGRGEEGARRLRLATSLDPSLMYAAIFLSRHHALRGEWAEERAIVEELERRLGPATAQLARAQRVRFAGWRGDRDELQRWAKDDTHRDSASWRVVRLYARALCGQLGDRELGEGLHRIFSSSQNPRFLSLTDQLATEMFAGRGEIEQASVHLFRAASSVLVDLEWLDRCPLLDPLRGLPGWDDARRRVRARAEAVWST